MKIKIICNDPHNPKGVFEFDEDYAKELVKSNPNYKFYDEGTVRSGESYKPEFNMDMSEKEIKSLIDKYKINVKYNISNEKKSDKLKELKSLGYDVDLRGED